jgi:23S rRNA pseudouridine1911/1915/1917 synthase
MKKRPRTGTRPARPSSRKPHFSREVVVLYEDDAIIALDKPAGLPAVPVTKNSTTPSAWSLLDTELRTRRQRAFVVHRIDRFTSGILLFAKSARDRDILVQQFLEHTPLRQYIAVIRGYLEKPEGTLVHYFRKQGQFQKLSTSKDKRAARAELRYIMQKELRDASLLRVALITGLQNQIRVQFSAIGHPVVGDRKYHPAEADEQRIARVALHATQLEFTHPRTGQSVILNSKLPQDMQVLVNKLSVRSS